MKGHVAGTEDSPVNRSLTMMIYKSFNIGPMFPIPAYLKEMHRPALDQFLFFILDLKKYIKSEVFCNSYSYLFYFPKFYFFVSRKNESLLIIPLIKSIQFL